MRRSGILFVKNGLTNVLRSPVESAATSGSVLYVVLYRSAAILNAQTWKGY